MYIYIYMHMIYICTCVCMNIHTCLPSIIFSAELVPAQTKQLHVGLRGRAAVLKTAQILPKLAGHSRASRPGRLLTFPFLRKPPAWRGTLKQPPSSPRCPRFGCPCKSGTLPRCSALQEGVCSASITKSVCGTRPSQHTRLLASRDPKP